MSTPVAWIMVLLHLLSWSTFICNPKMDIFGAEEFCFPSMVNILNGRQQAGLHLSIFIKGKFLKFLTWLVENIWFIWISTTQYDLVDHS